MQKISSMQTDEDECRFTHSHGDEKEYIILLERMWRVEPKPFISDKPIIGALIAAFRRAWNNVAARWYVQGLLEQQVPFNRLVANVIAMHDQQLDRHAKTFDKHAKTLEDYAHVLKSLDLTLQENVKHFRQILQSLDERLGSLERQMANLAHRLSAQDQRINLQGELIYDRGLSIGTLAEEIARSNLQLQELRDEMRALSEQLQRWEAESMLPDSTFSKSDE